MRDWNVTLGNAITWGCALILCAGGGWAQVITLNPASGPPSGKISVSGSGFAAQAAIEIYFDSTEKASATADAGGNFADVGIRAPLSASPGTHFVKATAPQTGASAQAGFLVETNWSQWGFSPSHDSFNRYENVLGLTTVGGAGLLWSSNDIGDHPSSPAVANGVVYVCARAAVTALDASTGKQLWLFGIPGSGEGSSPAVMDGVVYFGSTNHSVYALDAATGAQLWTYPTGNAVVPSPAVANGVVYVGSGDNKVYALNASTGARLWSFTAGGFVDSSPTVASGVVYVGSGDKNIYALDASTGAKLWSFTTGGLVESSQAVAGGIVYASSDDGNVYALNAASGALLWSFAAGAPVVASPAVANGVVYIGSYDSTSYAMCALDAATGSLLWSYSLDEFIDEPYTAAVANGIVYFTYGAAIEALNASTGALLWTSSPVGAITPPVVANGVVYAASSNAPPEVATLFAFGLPGLSGVQPGSSAQLSRTAAGAAR